MKLTAASLAFGLLSGASAAAIEPRATSPSVQIANGTINGVYLPTFDQEAFFGVPFARPAQRLRRPERLNTTYSAPFEATNPNVPFCPGFGSDNWAYNASEDCLLLNIVRPSGYGADAKLPVAVWFHGGGYQQGGIADIRYNSSWIVQRSVEMKKPIVWVAVAYRTAAGGFLNSAEIEAEGSTNNGLFDQRLALEWIQENVAQFSGDPSKVVLIGESAGAFAIGRHLLAFDGAETSLFRGAILQSGGPTSENFLTSEQSKLMYTKIVEKAGCANETSALACLRALPFDAWNASIAVTGTFRWNPVRDGGLVGMGSPTAQLKEGRFVQVPLLIGANLDEGTSFGAKGVNTTDQLKAALYTKYPGLSNSSMDALLEVYPDEPSEGCPYDTGDGLLPLGRQEKRSNSAYGDLYIVGPRRLLTEEAARKNPVFSYLFSQVPQNVSMTVGSAHFQEVAYVFSSQTASQNRLGNRPTDRSLAKLMTSYWVSFIADLNPNDSQYPDAPVWPEYATSQSNMVFKRQRSYVEKDDFRKEGIALMNSVEFGKELAH